MASVQYKVGKSGKGTYYIVGSLRGKHKWLKAGSLKDAKIPKRQIESMDKSRRIEKLGIVGRDKTIDDFFQEYVERVRLRTAPNTLKRYRSVLEVPSV